MTPRGRPVGTTESPQSLIRKDLQQTLKLQASIRAMVNEQLLKIQKLLNDDSVSLELRLKATEALASMSDTLTKSAKETIKIVTSQSEVEETTHREVDILEELKKGIKG